MPNFKLPAKGTALTLEDAALTLNTSDNITQVSILVQADARCGIQGSMPFRESFDNSAVLQSGQTVTISAPDGAVLDGWTFTAEGTVIFILLTT